MFDENVEKILARLGPGDRVLDIGGWARPFNRADYVLDMESYETRGYYGAQLPAQGGTKERFSRETWIRRDICAGEPYPFADKELDFVVCSHTLEDIRDPLRVCSEMIRIAKAGYIEVPSRVAESCRGIEAGQVGWSHHRWLIDIADDAIVFTMKYHKIHAHWRFSLPESHLRALDERDQVQWLFWEDRFDFREHHVHGTPAIEEELETFVARHHRYPEWRKTLDTRLRRARYLTRRLPEKLRENLRR